MPTETAADAEVTPRTSWRTPAMVTGAAAASARRTIVRTLFHRSSGRRPAPARNRDATIETSAPNENLRWAGPLALPSAGRGGGVGIPGSRAPALGPLGGGGRW